ncbi:MAG: galactosyltransferase-related protein [Steroidobacter sp.]
MLSLPQFTGFSRWMQRWYPSSVLKEDPLQDVRVDGRYAPIPLAGWKFTPSMAQALLAQRKYQPLAFSSQRLAVIIPVRDREAHLAVLIPRLIAALNEQGIQYRIIVSEQEAGKLWNKGAIFNAAIRHVADHCYYICFHDVDAIPVRGNYLCPSQPLRLVTHLVGSRNGLTRPPRYFGGVITALREQVYTANGFSNQYWAWGKEDDDFLFRLLFAGYVCYSDTEGTFEDLHNPSHQQVQLYKLIKPKTLKHNRQRRSLLMRGLLDPQQDGVNVAVTEILRRDVNENYERILVRV